VGRLSTLSQKPIHSHPLLDAGKTSAHKPRKAELLFSSRMQCMLNSVQACLTQCEN